MPTTNTESKTVCNEPGCEFRGSHEEYDGAYCGFHAPSKLVERQRNRLRRLREEPDDKWRLHLGKESLRKKREINYPHLLRYVQHLHAAGMIEAEVLSELPYEEPLTEGCESVGHAPDWYQDEVLQAQLQNREDTDDEDRR